eukprot:COSAG02_NODE_1856_length_10648_cov_8.834581_2_plen_718_part_00
MVEASLAGPGPPGAAAAPEVKIFACEHMGAGCGFVGLRGQVVEHEKHCPYSSNTPPVASPSVASARTPPPTSARTPPPSSARTPPRASSTTRRPQRAQDEAEVGVPPSAGSAAPSPRRSTGAFKTPPRRSPQRQTLTPIAPAQDLQVMPESTSSGINIGGKCYDVVPPSSSKRASKRRREEVTVELTETGKLSIGLEVLWPNETLAVFKEQKLGIEWVSYTGHHVEDHSHVVVERLEPDAAEARAHHVRPGCYLVRIGDQSSNKYHFNHVLDTIKESPRPLRLVLGDPSRPSPTRSYTDCVAWSIDESSAALDGVSPGMALAKVNGVSIRGKLLQQIKAEIAEAEQPVRLTFRERRGRRSSSRPSSTKKATPGSSGDIISPPRTPPDEGLPPTRQETSVSAPLILDVHRVLWEGWLHLLPDRHRHWFFIYQVDGEDCCRVAYRQDSGVEDAGGNGVDSQTPPVLSAQFKDCSPFVQVRAHTPEEPEHFVLQTRDGGEYHLSAGDEYVAQAVVDALQGNELKSEHKDAPRSERPPIIPNGVHIDNDDAAERIVTSQTVSDSVTTPNPPTSANGFGTICIGLLVLLCSIYGGTLADLVGYGTSKQAAADPTCASDVICGPHGSVHIFSSIAERDEQLGRPRDQAAAADRWSSRSNSVCACVCDEGWGGDDCRTAPMELLEVAWQAVSETVSAMHWALHEQLARMANGTDDDGMAAPDGR